MNLKKRAIYAALLTLSVALIGLIGHLPGLEDLGMIQAKFYPMAITTALAFITQSMIVLGLVYLKDRKSIVTIIFAFLGVFTAIYGILEIPSLYLDMDLNFENTIFPPYVLSDGAPSARMSSFTGALFFITGIAIMLLSVRRSSKDDRISSLIGILGTFAFLASLVAMIGYIMGTPLLYKSRETAKMAATTALSFFFLSSSIVFLSEANSIPVRYFIGDSTRSRLLRVFVPITALAVLMASLLSKVLPDIFTINPVLVFAVTSVSIMLATIILVGRVSDKISIEIDDINNLLKKNEKNLEDRVSDLTCLYSIADVIDTPGLTLDEIYKTVTNLIPQSWQYSLTMTARITINGKQFVTDHFNESNWRLSAEINVNGKKIGVIEIFYLDEVRPEVESPFLKEARNLIDAIAEMLSRTIEKRIVEEKNVEYQDNLEKLVERRTELLDETGRLAKVGGLGYDVMTSTLSFSKETYRIFGIPVESPPTLEEALRYFTSEARPVIEKAIVAAVHKGHDYDLELPFRKASGESIWVRVQGRAQSDGEKIIRIHGSLQDITERKTAEKKVQHMAYHDQLTKLPNRRLLNDRLNRDIAQAKRRKRYLAILFIDIDGFKQVNDVYGHDVGDLLLLEIAKRLTGSVRTEDTVARIGGDEFVASLANISNIDDIKKVTEKVLSSIVQPFVIGDHDIYVSASIGIRLYPLNGKKIDILLRKADTALHNAKTKKNYYVFYGEEAEKAA